MNFLLTFEGLFFMAVMTFSVITIFIVGSNLLLRRKAEKRAAQREKENSNWL